ncbi:MAG TPA: aldose epimerase family protein [Rhizorhapis sp.]|nr:aldose epimerase family protein [Rhizorhapis sp.]
MARALRSPFGTLPSGHAVDAVVLSNDRGMSATVITFGARLQSVVVPDRNGVQADVTPGFASIDGYLADPHYFGATVGRFANRIAEGRFYLDGTEHSLDRNDGPHALHGGICGFDKLPWKIVRCEESSQNASVSMRLVSPDGDQGYPGRLSVTATFSLDERDCLSIVYEATSDAPTIVNITNHAYWNLAGENAEASADNHRLILPAEHFLPTANGVPTGERRAVKGTPFDFRQPRIIADALREMTDPSPGFDQCWIVSSEENRAVKWAATLLDPISGRSFALHSNQAGLQFYSGNCFNGETGKSGRAYTARYALAFEPQAFPNSPNQPDFPATILAPGAVYRNEILYCFDAQ